MLPKNNSASGINLFRRLFSFFSPEPAPYIVIRPL